ncbi:MAG: hypothetical protein K9K68_03755 [Methylococcaceae bacterium]|jgi:hypothetical protein|nr:hypothetical protein [Methylococcaceae bacterium]
MAATAIISNPRTVEREVLMFYRENPAPSARQDHSDQGAIARFYRHIYPTLAVEPKAPEAWLESLIQRNSWLR